MLKRSILLLKDYKAVDSVIGFMIALASTSSIKSILEDKFLPINHFSLACLWKPATLTKGASVTGWSDVLEELLNFKKVAYAVFTNKK